MNHCIKVIIDEQKKQLLKKDVIKIRIRLFIFIALFSIAYLIITLFEYFFFNEDITIKLDVSMGLFVFFLCVFSIIFNINYINRFFRQDYSNNPTEIEYSYYDDYLLIHNISIDKKSKIYTNMVRYIFYKENCAVVLVKGRRMYIIPNEVNIGILDIHNNSF